MMRTANPALNEKVFMALPYEEGASMTINGTVNKTAIFLGLTVISASWTWGLFSTAPERVMPWMIVGLIGGLITCLITIFQKRWAAVTGSLYCVFEGLALGGISAAYEAQFNGIVLQAVILTFGTLACLLIAYRSGIIKATENFKLGVVAATGGIFLVYFVTIILSLFGVGVPFIHSNGIGGIIFSLFVVVIAALNLVLDFDFIEHGADTGAPKYMEWYAAFGLMVTLIWLYLEILRLLAKSRRR